MNRGSTRAALALLLAAVCGGAQALDIGRILNVLPEVVQMTGLSEAQEIEAGKVVAGRLLGAAPLVADADVQAYVNRVGRWIAAQSERPNLPWQFGVIDSPSINAFAAPGGIVFITRGLYDALTSEAQLAGVLGHEIAHVLRRHHVAGMQKTAALSAGAKLVQGETRNELASRLVGTGAEVFARGLDKSDEFEADRIGVVLAARAGYTPYGLVEVLHMLGARATDDDALALLFQTHPHPDERLERLGAALTPRVESLPQGASPALRAIDPNAPAPAISASGDGNSPPSEAQALQPEAPAQAQPGAPAIDPGQLLRGLFGR